MFDKLTFKLLIDSAQRNVCSLPHFDSGNQNTLDLLHKQIKIMTEHIPSSFSQLNGFVAIGLVEVQKPVQVVETLHGDHQATISKLHAVLHQAVVAIFLPVS